MYCVSDNYFQNVIPSPVDTGNKITLSGVREYVLISDIFL